MIRLAILISGRGSNMLALADAIEDFGIDAEIAIVISNKDCDGITLAAKRGMSTKVIKRRDFDTRSNHDTAIAAAITASNADYVFLAGYMTILSSDFVEEFTGKLINIHPSLLPEFKGLDTHQRAIDAGALRHGASVHLVNAELDDGPLILQAWLDVNPSDTAEGLATRVLRLEHQLYPFVLFSLAEQHLGLSPDGAEWRVKDAALTAAPAAMRDVLAPCLCWPDDLSMQ
jgi:phosphoribosylglycinamide formyltransferase-1